MRQSSRRQIMLDQSVQGALIKRVSTYWFLCMGATIFMSWLWSSFTNPEMTVGEWSEERLLGLVIPLLGSLLFLPLAWVDMVRLSNRVVAPVHSIRTAIRRVLMGDDVPPLAARPDDFWQDLTRQFNRLSSVTTLNPPAASHADLDPLRNSDESPESERKPMTLEV